eukprot:767827-Hanusia_phi.AAC.1
MEKISWDGWWTVQITVRPVAVILRSTFITILAARESSPDVGSSRKRMLGFAAISTPMVTRLRCSSDRPTPFPPMVLWRNGRSSTRSATACTTVSFSSLESSGGRRWRAENLRASRT